MPQHYNEDKLMSDIRWGTGYYSDEDFQEQGKNNYSRTTWFISFFYLFYLKLIKFFDSNYLFNAFGGGSVGFIILILIVLMVWYFKECFQFVYFIRIFIYYKFLYF